MRFRFPFQKIVNLKFNEKTQAEWMLARALDKLKAEERSLDELATERERQIRKLAEASEKPTPISEIQALQHYIESLERQMERKRQDISRAQADVADKQQALRMKMQDEKIWLKAREKAFAKFTAAVLKNEQNEIDEIAVTRYHAGR